MTPILRTAPISDMKSKQENVMEMLSSGPVVLMERSQPAAVIVSPDEWNRTAKQIAMLETIMAGQRALANDAPTISSAEMRERMTKRGVMVG